MNNRNRTRRAAWLSATVTVADKPRADRDELRKLARGAPPLAPTVVPECVEAFAAFARAFRAARGEKGGR